MRRTFSVMSTNKTTEEEQPIRRQNQPDSFTQKIQNNQALQLNRGFMKRPTSGTFFSKGQLLREIKSPTCYPIKESL